jgi:hypothetical protein
VEVNIPLLNVIKQIPRYVKILKELCTNKKKCENSKENKSGRECICNHTKKIASEIQESRYVYYTLCDWQS